MARFIPQAYVGKRSTATAGELHGERDDGEEVHLELLAWLVLVTPIRPGSIAAGLRQLSLIGGDLAIGLSRIR